MNATKEAPQSKSYDGNKPPPGSGTPARSNTKTSVNTWSLSPQTNAELRITGDVTLEDLELLRQYVEITIKALSRTANHSEREF